MKGTPVGFHVLHTKKRSVLLWCSCKYCSKDAFPFDIKVLSQISLSSWSWHLQVSVFHGKWNQSKNRPLVSLRRTLLTLPSKGLSPRTTALLSFWLRVFAESLSISAPFFLKDFSILVSFLACGSVLITLINKETWYIWNKSKPISTNNSV